MKDLNHLYSKYLGWVNLILDSDPPTNITDIIDDDILKILLGEKMSTGPDDFGRELTLDEFEVKIKVDPSFIEKISK